MLNSVMLVGRLIEDVNEGDKGFAIAVPRSFKNNDGEYDKDIIPVKIWEGITNHMANYCKSGDMVGIKGRIEVQDEKVVVVAEKITFLSSKKESDK